jgi:hypothetical protein
MLNLGLMKIRLVSASHLMRLYWQFNTVNNVFLLRYLRRRTVPRPQTLFVSSVLMINPNPPQVLQTFIPSASLKDFPDPSQEGQKIMPYFSGSILPPFAFLSIPIPPSILLDKGKLSSLKRPLDCKSEKYAAF